MFSWKPIHAEAARKILEFRDRQGGLLEILREMQKQGLKTISLEDNTSDGRLGEIDPFTFLATFNRGLSDENRKNNWRFLKEQWRLAASVPADFSGIPLLHPTNSWFFPTANKRQPDHVRLLWHLAGQSVDGGIEAIDGSLFDRCLTLEQVGIASLSIGLFWVNPESFLPADHKTLSYGKANGVSGKLLDFQTYQQWTTEMAAKFGNDYPKISHDADQFATQKPPLQPPERSYPALLRRYQAEKIVFASSSRNARYFIASCDDSGVSVERLDANAPQRVTFAQAEKLIGQARESGRRDFARWDNTSAVRNAVLQAECLALSGDHQSVVYAGNNPARLACFIEAIDAMNMQHPLYKPAMLLCVVDGIEDGDLVDNRIAFDWIAPRFITRLKSLGHDVTERQAAQPFYHLSGELFWLHAVQDPKDLMRDGGDGPAAARSKIKYALIKDTFWNLLQDPASRAAVRRRLEDLMRPPILIESILPMAEEAVRKTGFLHAPGLVARFLSAAAAKPFVILTGNSGTGKTKLAQLLARWLAGASDENASRYTVVPVGADWTDNRNVVGFVNHLRKDAGQNPLYASTPVLDLVLRARSDPARPWFLILDEMNLSHVERYFSDFLSAMESHRTIPLHGEKNEVFTAAGASVPPEISFPDNLFVIGTVNVDETTYMFSPKVLDRANVIEFRIDPTQAKEFLAQTRREVNSIDPSQAAGAAFLEVSRRARGLSSPALPPPEDKLLQECRRTVEDLFAILHDSRLEFAFRTIAEIMRYITVDFTLSPDKPKWSWRDCVDAQVLQKILPKLHGSRRRMEPILASLASYCERRDANCAKQLLEQNSDLTAISHMTPSPDAALPMSRAKLLEMLSALRRDQFVSFIQ